MDVNIEGSPSHHKSKYKKTVCICIRHAIYLSFFVILEVITIGLCLSGYARCNRLSVFIIALSSLAILCALIEFFSTTFHSSIELQPYRPELYVSTVHKIADDLAMDSCLTSPSQATHRKPIYQPLIGVGYLIDTPKTLVSIFLMLFYSLAIVMVIVGLIWVSYQMHKSEDMQEGLPMPLIYLVTHLILLIIRMRTLIPCHSTILRRTIHYNLVNAITVNPLERSLI